MPEQLQDKLAERRSRYLCWLTAWFATVYYAAFVRGWPALLLWVFFPCGLGPRRHFPQPSANLHFNYCVVGWLGYAVLTLLALKTRRTANFFLLLGVLVLLLIMNVSGYVTFLDDLAHEPFAY